MKHPPENVVEILARLFPSKAKNRHRCGPFNAVVVPLNDDDRESGDAVLATVHSVTASQACFVHGTPLVGKRLRLAVTAESGEVLRIVVRVRSTSRRGSLYKTTAGFLPA